MKSGPISGSASKLKVVGMRWIMYALLVVFAVVMLGVVLPVPFFGSVAPLYDVAGGLVILVALVVYGFFDSTSKAGRLATRLTSQAAGSDAGVQSLKRNFDESSSETKKRLSVIETNVTNVGDGVARFSESMRLLQTETTALRSQIDKIGQAVSAVSDAVVESQRAMVKAAEAEANLGRQIEQKTAGLGGELKTLETSVEGEVKNLEGKISQVGATTEENKKNLRKADDSVTKLEDAIAKLRASISAADEVASATGKVVVALSKKTSGLETKVTTVEKGQQRKVTRVAQSVSKLESRLAKLAKTEKRVSKMEKNVSKLGSKVSKTSTSRRAPPRRASKARRKPKASEKQEPAQPVPQEVRELEPPMPESQDTQAESQPQEPETTPQQ